MGANKNRFGVMADSLYKFILENNTNVVAATNNSNVNKDASHLSSTDPDILVIETRGNELIRSLHRLEMKQESIDDMGMPF
jgi:hypothetical protein